VRHRVQLLAAQRGLSAALASAGGPPRAAPRRGAGGLPGRAAMGWSTRLGWDAGVPLLLAVTPVGVMTGCGLGPARTTDPPLADPFVALRRHPHPQGPSVGGPARGPAGVDQGFEGKANQARGWQPDGAEVIGPPKRQSQPPWPQALRRWRAGGRQIVETVDDQLLHPLRLDRERPHDRSGLWARLAAKIALHNFCIWLNEPRGRPLLAFTDIVDW
jgi:hypothetical protein